MISIIIRCTSTSSQYLRRFFPVSSQTVIMRIANAVLEALDNLLNPSDGYAHLSGDLTRIIPFFPHQHGHHPARIDKMAGFASSGDLFRRNPCDGGHCSHCVLMAILDTHIIHSLHQHRQYQSHPILVDTKISSHLNAKRSRIPATPNPYETQLVKLEGGYFHFGNNHLILYTYRAICQNQANLNHAGSV